MLSNLIFISNSMPKSGSTLLFNLQRDLLNKLSGRATCDYSALEDNNINHINGFISAQELPKLLRKLSDGLSFAGPIVLKTHSSITPHVREIYENDDRIFMSTIVRDPLDATMSAIENHKRTGEFEQFKTIESACKSVNNFYQSIYDTTIAVKGKPIPLIRYENLVRDPLLTIRQSFHPKLIDIIILEVFKRNVDLSESCRKARHRLQRGDVVRTLDIIPMEDRGYVLDALSDFRAKLGYLSR